MQTNATHVAGTPDAFVSYDTRDPLQNMDELTVTTIARGLGKLLRLWQRIDSGETKWRVAILLHGEENLERLRLEAPCAVYLLPWLSPAARLNEKLVFNAEPPRSNGELEELGSLIRFAPQRAARRPERKANPEAGTRISKLESATPASADLV